MAEVAPVLLSAVICERVIFDKITGMASLINIIGNINSPVYPSRHWLNFFCEFTDGHGDTATKIRIVEAGDEDKVIFEQAGVVQFTDVKQIVTLAINMQGIVFPKPGEYRFQIYASNTLLGERKVMLRKMEQQKQE
jgi:hypothetical protein